MAVVQIIGYICGLYQDGEDLLKKEDPSGIRERKRKQKKFLVSTQSSGLLSSSSSSLINKIKLFGAAHVT